MGSKTLDSRNFNFAYLAANSDVQKQKALLMSSNQKRMKTGWTRRSHAQTMPIKLQTIMDHQMVMCLGLF